MARVRIELPATFDFTTTIPIRITDVNYGGHVGNDAILSLIHEVRMQFLNHFHYSEMDFAGVGMIMSDVSIEFKSEAFYGDVLKAYVTSAQTGKVSFDIYYKITKEKDSKEINIAIAKTGMVCYDYKNKKISAIPEEVITTLKMA